MAGKSVTKKQEGAKGGRQGMKLKGSAVFTLDELTGHVRVHFSNGHSGEYSAQALRHCAPFDLNEVVSIEKI